MKIATLFLSSLAVTAAFTTGKNAFVRQTTSLMASPTEFVQTEIAAHDVSIRGTKYIFVTTL
jgi:hypothetical protein